MVIGIGIGPWYWYGVLVCVYLYGNREYLSGLCAGVISVIFFAVPEKTTETCNHIHVYFFIRNRAESELHSLSIIFIVCITIFYKFNKIWFFDKLVRGAKCILIPSVISKPRDQFKLSLRHTANVLLVEESKNLNTGLRFFSYSTPKCAFGKSYNVRIDLHEIVEPLEEVKFRSMIYQLHKII